MPNPYTRVLWFIFSIAAFCLALRWLDGHVAAIVENRLRSLINHSVGGFN